MKLVKNYKIGKQGVKIILKMLNNKIRKYKFKIRQNNDKFYLFKFFKLQEFIFYRTNYFSKKSIF